MGRGALVERLCLPLLAVRARNLQLIADGYGLPAAGRARLVQTMIALAIADTANEAVEAQLTPESTAPVEALWAMAWRSRSAAWMLRHRAVLEGVMG